MEEVKEMFVKMMSNVAKIKLNQKKHIWRKY